MRIARTQQKGSTLLVMLILLLILSVIAVRQFSFMTVNTKSISNTRDAMNTYFATEGALSQASTALLTGGYTTNNFSANSNGLFLFNPTTAPIWSTINWAAAIPSTFTDTSVRAAYIIELLPAITPPGSSMKKPTFVYRITARGTRTDSPVAPVILQSIVLVPQ